MDYPTQKMVAAYKRATASRQGNVVDGLAAVFLVVEETHTVLPTLLVARLVVGHLVTLWDSWTNGTEDDEKGCCYYCCGNCYALKLLHDTGDLDRLVGVYINRDGASDIWNARKGEVDRNFLNAAWSVDRGCGPHPKLCAWCPNPLQPSPQFHENGVEHA